MVVGSIPTLRVYVTDWEFHLKVQLSKSSWEVRRLVSQLVRRLVSQLVRRLVSQLVRQLVSQKQLKMAIFGTEIDVSGPGHVESGATVQRLQTESTAEAFWSLLNIMGVEKQAVQHRKRVFLTEKWSKTAFFALKLMFLAQKTWNWAQRCRGCGHRAQQKPLDTF